MALFNLPAYEKCVRDSCKRLGLSHLRITPHMCRHGGISTDVYEGILPLSEAQTRGHWPSPRSVARYEKHARLLDMISKLTDVQLTQAIQSAEKIGRKMLKRG